MRELIGRPAGPALSSGRLPSRPARRVCGIGLWSDVMTEFDAASAAVQAALDAGARYADARVMHRRYESMSARNGDIESLVQDSRLRASAYARWSDPGWGFYAVADLEIGALARAGARAAEIAAASALVARGDVGAGAGRAGARARGRAVRDRPVRGVARRQGRPAGAGDDDDARARCRPRRGAVPGMGHPEVVRLQRGPPHRPAHPRGGAGISATAIGDGETQRRSYPAARGQYGTRGWEFVDELDLEAHAARVGSEARELLDRPAVPERGDDADPRRRAAGAADPRVGRATRSSSTGSSAGRRRTPAPRGSTSPSSGRCATARS